MKTAVFHFDTLKVLKSFPRDVQQSVGFALDGIQRGDELENVKKLKGLSDVYQLTVRGTDGTFRTVFAFIGQATVDVIHIFNKKSKTGIKTPKEEMEKIRRRLKKLR